MKYNCLRINPYAKMFVVGLLLYLGETVFFKCSEEGTFTVKVMITLTNVVIEVHNCKGTDELSEFMKKFEDAYDKEINDGKIKGIKYNLIHNNENIVIMSEPINNKSLADYGIGKNSILHLIRLEMASKSDEELANPKVGSKHNVFQNINVQPIKIERRKSADMKKLNSYISLQNEFIIGPLNGKKDPPYGHKKKSSSTSTCPLRRCCRICGC